MPQTPPKILALDSSTDACSVALHLDGKSTHIFELAAKSHTQRLLPMVDEILGAAGCDLGDLDAIAYGRGPGSFTGLRICMGIVQGLAFGANLPVIGISTLQAMAQGYRSVNPDNQLPILPALDARMDEVYWGLFNPDLSLNIEEQVSKPDMVVAEAGLHAAGRRVIAIGSGWHYGDLASLAPETIQLDMHPNAKDILALALPAYAAGASLPVMEAQLVYLRDSVSWQKRQRIRSQSLT